MNHAQIKGSLVFDPKVYETKGKIPFGQIKVKPFAEAGDRPAKPCTVKVFGNSVHLLKDLMEGNVVCVKGRLQSEFYTRENLKVDHAYIAVDDHHGEITLIQQS